jgi:endoglucanase
MIRCRIIIVILLLSATVTLAQDNTPTDTRDIARCVNLGNMLEAPNEGDWGLVVQHTWLQTIASAGFDTVRIPIKWSGHAERDAPYTIDPTFFARIDEVVGWALDAGLQAIINIHHYDEIMQRPAQEHERLLALWAQIAVHYQDYPDTVIYEALNEPNSRLNSRRWNAYQADVVEVIRRSNPDRRIISSPSPTSPVPLSPYMEQRNRGAGDLDARGAGSCVLVPIHARP